MISAQAEDILEQLTAGRQISFERLMQLTGRGPREISRGLSDLFQEGLVAKSNSLYLATKKGQKVRGKIFGREDQEVG